MSAWLPGNGWKWKWSLGLLNLGVVGMTAALLIAGYEQSFIERAVGGSTGSAFFAAQSHPWFVQGMVWRNVVGFVTAIRLGLLVWDLMTLGRGERRIAPAAGAQRELACIFHERAYFGRFFCQIRF